MLLINGVRCTEPLIGNTATLRLNDGERQLVGEAILVRLLARQAAAEHFEASRVNRDRR
ncbi:hypothetical protein ACFQ15_02650 [Sphingomonas hankookensis]|uniref:hypothetical protein n=1 Tax=Sphingomonas hankookensis TaxID=563996 RepID=UPI001F58BBB6|nr:hypothetical protein [Sphingomonas hankookensis]